MPNDIALLQRKLYAQCQAFAKEKIERMRKAMDEAMRRHFGHLPSKASPPS